MGYVPLKLCGTVSCNSSFDCQVGMHPCLKYIKFDHVIGYLDTVDFGPVYTAPVQLLHRNRRFYGSAYRLHCYELSVTLLAPVTGTLSVPAKKA